MYKVHWTITVRDCFTLCPHNQRPHAMQFIFTLAGHNFRPTECKAALAEAHHGTDHSLDLELDPTNEYDPNAVKVMLTVLSDEYFVGFIPKDTAADVAAILRDDEGSVAPGHTSEINELRILD